MANFKECLRTASNNCLLDFLIIPIQVLNMSLCVVSAYPAPGLKQIVFNKQEMDRGKCIPIKRSDISLHQLFLATMKGNNEVVSSWCLPDYFAKLVFPGFFPLPKLSCPFPSVGPVSSPSYNPTHAALHRHQGDLRAQLVAFFG